MGSHNDQGVIGKQESQHDVDDNIYFECKLKYNLQEFTNFRRGDMDGIKN